MDTEEKINEGVIEIDFNNKSIKGYCRKKNIPNQFDKLKEVIPMKITFEIKENPHELKEADELAKEDKEMIILDSLAEGFGIDKDLIKILRIEEEDLKMKYKDLIKKIKKDYPKISEEQVLSTCRHIKAILSEWKLSVQSDILQYLNEDFECEDLTEEKNTETRK